MRIRTKASKRQTREEASFLALAVAVGLEEIARNGLPPEPAPPSYSATLSAQPKRSVTRDGVTRRDLVLTPEQQEALEQLAHRHRMSPEDILARAAHVGMKTAPRVLEKLAGTPPE